MTRLLLVTKEVEIQEKPRTQENKDIFRKPQSITELRGKSKFTTSEAVAIETPHRAAGENAGSSEHTSSLMTDNAALGDSQTQVV